MAGMDLTNKMTRCNGRHVARTARDVAMTWQVATKTSIPPSFFPSPFPLGSSLRLPEIEMRSHADPSKRLQTLLKQCGGCLAIDGGLATHLESLGANINDPLWSALCLLTQPELIKQVHWEYLDAGAQVIITASYQATIPGFLSKGISILEAESLLKRSVEIAVEARDAFHNCRQKLDEDLQPALVAASIGSYGAYLADGSEYSGIYGPEMTVEKLKDFHRRRLQLLVEAGPDLLAFETTPNKLEAQAYIELIKEEEITIPSWITFNSKDGVNVVSGDSFQECIQLADECPGIVAVGINCTPPRFIHGLILSAQKVTSKPIVIYPNSGETWDGEKKQWVVSDFCDIRANVGDMPISFPSTGVSDVDFVSYVRKWREAGAALIGGCCRTTPNTIKAISVALKRDDQKLMKRELNLTN